MTESPSYIPIIGIIASLIALLGLVVRFFVKTLERKDADQKELTQKFIDLTEEMLDAKGKQLSILLQVVGLLEKHTPILEKLVPILERHGEILTSLSNREIIKNQSERRPVPRR